jgi:hypothetical protein
MQVLGHTSVVTSFSYANVVIITFVKVEQKDYEAEISRLSFELRQINDKFEEQKSMIQKLLAHQPAQTAEVEEILQLVALPGINGVLVNVPKFELPLKRFKKDDEAKQKWQQEYKDLILEALHDVDISKMTDEDWKRLGVPRDIGRSLK